MHMRKWYTYVLILIFFTFNGTTKEKSAGYEPADGNVIWISGKPYSKKVKNNIEVSVSYQSHMDRKILFHVNITNNSNADILVNPTEFFYEFEPIGRSSNNLKYHGKNPEYALRDIDLEIDQENQRFENSRKKSMRQIKNYNDQQAVDAGFGCLMLGLDAAATTSGKHTRESKRDARRVMRDISEDIDTLDAKKERTEANMLSLESLHLEKIKYYNDKKRDIDQKRLRKTTLEPKKNVSGEIEFFLHDDADIIFLKVNLYPTDYSFIFKRYH